VVRSHYGETKKVTSEMIYAAGEGIAAWLGLSSWVDVAEMQRPETVARFRELIAASS